MKKRFDPQLHADNDQLTRQAVKDLLKDSGLNVVDNVKKRGVDLLVYDDKGKHVANIECERKVVWSGTDFKYTDVNFPHRKEKYALLEKPTIFIMFNKEMSDYLTVTGDVLVTSPLKEVPNKYVYSGEKFYKVPITKCKFNDLINVLKGVI